MKKSELRKTYLNQRKNLSESEYQQINEGILAQIQGFDFSAYKLIHLFLPIKKNKEPDTYLIHEYLEKSYPALKFTISKSLLDHPTVYHFLWDKKVIIKENKWGIPEPIGGVQVLPPEIDVVLVPLLVADLTGNRVGYGKGYYDIFLSQCKPQTLKIGISMFPLIEKISDASSFDVKLDYIVTPTETFNIKKGL